MRILFDHQVFSWQTYGGISRYFAEQMRGLQALGQEVFLPENFFSENVYLRQLPEFRRNSLAPFSFKGKKMLQNVLGRRASLHALEQAKPDIFHPTYFDPYFLKTAAKRGIPFVLTVHDMIHEIYGHGSHSPFSLDANVVQNKRLLAEKAAAVIAVSENTRQDLLRFCPDLDPAKIHVIHHGNSLLNDECKMMNDESPTVPRSSFVIHHSSFILFVGQRKAYKNFAWMLEHLAALLRSEKGLELCCVGGGAFDAVEKAQLMRLGIAAKVRYLAVSSDAELAEVYTSAACFIFPSQYEGFGIPVLEAFACGCPVVLNRASSLPEVGGDAAVYFEEKSPESLEAAVCQVLKDSSFRKMLVARGRERAEQFTWQRSVEKHLALYRNTRIWNAEW
ncbi:MAG: glycosyltransferase family 4 protein [Saprospiraceae bacterium]